MGRLPSILIWLALLAAIAVPIIAAAQSPLLAWRQPIYIIAGFAGIVALAILLVQPLLAAGLLPGFTLAKARKLHLFMGITLVASVLLHVGGLWITSPPDVIDALTFTSPTPFSVWGVIAMWAVFAAAMLAALRKRIGLRPMTWRKIHTLLAAITVLGTAAHAMLIEGTMETVTKAALCC
ncbi:MAG: ferric reductase-like transmembrane domain-containing protein, partial [Pseudomonadota bacterium]